MTDRFRASRKAYRKSRFRRCKKRFFEWLSREDWWQEEYRDAADQFWRERIGDERSRR